MKTNHKNTRKRKTILVIVITILIILLGFLFWSKSKHQHKVAIEKNKDPDPTQLVSTCEIDYYKRHIVSPDIVHADIIYVKIDPIIDFSGQASKYPLWQSQVRHLTNSAIAKMMGSNKRFGQTNFRIYAANQYKDSYPEPQLTLEIYLMEYAITHGSKEQWKKTYCAEDVHGNYFSTDVTRTTKYKKVLMKSEFRLIDNHCRLIVSRPEKIEHTQEQNWTYFDGSKEIVPKIIVLNSNWQPHQLTKLRNDEYVTMIALKKLIERVLARNSSFLSVIATRRAGINLKDYSGIIE